MRAKAFIADTAEARIAELEQENRELRAEIRVAHEAAELTAHLVVQQFERSESFKGELRTTSGRLQAVLDAAAQVAILATDAGGRVDLCNRGAERMLGWSMQEMRGLRRMGDILMTVAGWDPAAEADLLGALARRCSGESCEATLRRADGETFPVNLAVTRLHDIEGTLYGYLTVAMDITPLKRAEEQLQQSYRELQAANAHLRELDKMKSDFLSSVSHELRTPLTSIRGFAKLIGRDFQRTFAGLVEDDKKLARKAARIGENLEIILGESERLTRLINDVLDLTKIESGRMSWNDEELDPAEVIKQAEYAARGQFEAKPEVKLRVRVAANSPRVLSDRDRLVQVLVNLLNNAAKFTNRGDVTVEAGADGRGWLSIRVIDTGIGFDPEEAEAIFDKFSQAKHSDTLTEKPKGTGLGLSICREILRHYGGDVSAASKPGAGSVFTLTLPPLWSLQQAPAPELSAGDASAPLLLVVDDDPGVRRYLAQLFEENGYRVALAEDGEAALEKARTLHPDLVTMDLAMPVMDGHEAIRALRADPALRHIRIIVVTAMPNRETPGANAAFAKPIQESKLLAGVELLLNRSGQHAEPMRCLMVHAEGEPRGDCPPFCDQVDHCTLKEVMEWVEAGYKGVLIIPTILLKRVDLNAVQARSNSQVVILPVDSAPEERPEG